MKINLEGYIFCERWQDTEGPCKHIKMTEVGVCTDIQGMERKKGASGGQLVSDIRADVLYATT